MWCPTKYTVGDNELLIIAKEFCTVLLSSELHIHTDHLNITIDNTSPNFIIHWLDHIQQFNTYIYWIPGEENVVANISCLD